MKTLRSIYILYILAILLLCCNRLEASHYYFKQISLQDGLPSTVRCIYAEDKGFVWIGTKSGLGRFDGHELKKYTHQAGNPNSLPHNNIHQITEDKQHNIWILTENGIACYRRNSDDFYIPKNEEGKNILVNTAYETPEGVIFGARNQIFQYNYNDRSFTRLIDFSSDSPFSITGICFWNPETLLCCSRWQGMLLIDLHTGKRTLPPFDCGKEIMGMIVDSQNRIWIAPYNDGIYCYSPDGTLLASYTTRNSKLTNNVVLCMAERDSRIWIGTDGGGINILDPETNTFSTLEHIPGDNYSLPVNSILCLNNDSENNMWAGTIRSGLISIREVSMKTYTDAIPGSDRGLSDNTVLSIYQEGESERIWIGTDGGGLNSLDPDSGKFKHYLSTWGEKIASISGFTPGELLLSIFSKGLFIYNKNTEKRQPLIIINDEINKQLCTSGKTVNVYQNSPETVLLLGTHIYRYTIRSKKFDVATEEEGMEIVGTVHPISHSSQETYINDNHSIYKLNHATNHLQSLLSTSKDTIINSVSRDEEGIFWIGGNQGLSCYNPETHQFYHIDSGLFGEINSLVCDGKGKVWIGADSMVFAWLIKEKRFIIFSESDGVILNEYLYKPRIISRHGDIYMGGVKGLLRIDNELPVETTEHPELQLTDVTVNGELVNNELTENSGGISVPWSNKAIITVRVMSHEQDIFRKKIYRYRIDGLNDQYIDSYNPELVIRSLPAGNYKVMAACSTKDGNWTPEKEILYISILPPWYKTWWFILMCILIISGGIIAAFLVTLRRKENKLKWTMKEHEQQVYEEKVRFLINISHELRTPLTLIHAPLNRILKILPKTDLHYLPLKSIYRQSQRMRDLLNMVLDVRKMEVGESKLQLKPYLLNEWIHAVSDDFISEGEAQNIRFNYRLDDEIGYVSFDGDKCQIILSNLLINALKHSPVNSEIIIASELLSGQDRARISIIDQGCGLKQVDTDKLFTRFYQGNGEQSGTGIGLSYSKILVELHGGTIGAKNNNYNGATFFFELPLNETVGEIVCQPKAYLNELITDDTENKSTIENDFPTSGYSVLIVDDNHDLVVFLKDALAGHFKNIYTATDGMEAMGIITTHLPDIIVSDVMMPRTNGFELCRLVKLNIDISHIPVILLTARDDEQSKLQGYKTGADAYLTKPFEIDTLIELIRNRLQYRENTKIRYQNSGTIPKPEECTISQADETFLFKLNKVIADNLDSSQLDIPFICKEVGVSRASLYNKLKALTDMGANDYINKFKMEKAIELVSTTELTFTEIAEKTGFTTSRYFSTAFKQYTGETPTHYRTNTRKGVPD